MTRALIAVGVLLGLGFTALGIVVYASRDEDAMAVDNLLAEQLTRAVATREAFDLAELAPFGWDRVLIAKPDVTPAQISQALGTPFRGELNIRNGDLLVFAEGKRITRFADYRGAGRFELGAPVASVRRDRARFVVDRLVVRLAP